MDKDNLTQKQLGPDGQSQWAVFLPAISGFYATFIGKQRREEYVDINRLPATIKDMEMLNWLNSSKSLFPYKWSLYSAGHANLDLTKDDPTEDMVRDREEGSFILGDSGGFQIAKGLWEGDWRDPNSAEVKADLAARAAAGKVKKKNKKGKVVEVDLVKEQQTKLAAAQQKREAVLKWLEGIADYSMILDIPTWVIHDKKASEACCITTYSEAVAATKYNNEYFMANRKGVKNGGTKFLNVLQGSNHQEAHQWYDMMKGYCDPALYPDTHFDGWAMGGQNMCDVDLVLRRLVALRYDNLLQEGKHDWMHFLGTSKLEWAVLLTVLQRAVRKYVNPKFTISFDCASPFLATANGQVYHHIDLPHNKKWCYRMAPSIDDKKYANDTRSFRDVALTDYIDHFKHFDESPVSARCQIKDICIYNDGIRKTDAELNGEKFDFQNPDHYTVVPDLNKIGKIGRTSWDSFSYALQMSHNVWTHLHAVQEANRKFDSGEFPAMMRRNGGMYEKFEVIVEEIFSAPDRATAESIIKQHEKFWLEIPGTRGFTGKRTINAHAKFNELFDIVETDNDDDSIEFDEQKLDDLEQSQ